MEFRRSGQRDERRRRVLLDESRQSEADRPAGGNRPSGETSLPRKSYAEAARDPSQPPLTWLIPKRPWTLAVLGLSNLAVIAGLASLYSAVFLPQDAGRQLLWRCCDLQAPGSLAGWYASLLLAAGGAASLLVYLLRRHKVDDYRGRYRVWIWTAAGFLLASLVVATHAHVGLAAWLGERLSPWVGGGPALWPLVVCGLPLLALGARLGFELRPCRLASAGLLGAGLLYAAAGGVASGGWPDGGELLSALAQSVSLLLGHLLAVFAVLVFARQVHREVHGQAGTPRRRARRTAAETSPPPTVGASIGPAVVEAGPTRPRSARSKAQRVDPPHEPAAPRPSSAAAERDSGDATADAEPADEAHLSKAEKRRLRKQMRRQNRR